MLRIFTLVRLPKIGVLALIVAVAGTACKSPSSAPAAQQAAAKATPDTDTWAIVDGKAITRNDVEKAFRRMSDAQAPSEEDALSAKLGILDDLILEEILLAKARQQNIQVADTEVDNAFNDMKKNVPDAQFQQQLTQRNLTVADMREGIRRQLLTQKVIEHDVSAKVTVTDQQVIDFFNANRSQFNLPEDSFHLAQIVVTPAKDPQIANRTGDDATTPQAATAKVTMLMDRLKQGAPFADLARDYSEDPDSAPRGGDLGLVPMSAVKQAPAPLRDAVLQMTPGKARVVNQNGAVAIVYLVSQERAGQRDLSTPGVRDQIANGLKARREQLLRNAYLDIARSDARIENILARRVVDAQGKVPDLQAAAK